MAQPGKKMKVIEPTKSPVNSKKEKNEKLRVAAYARVSSETDEQENSFENQQEYFMWLINSNPNYKFAGLYADEGITGTSTKNRQGFQQMMTDALDGKIDLILVKSISRFGRNTLDTLNSCRTLKNADIDVYFEKENIHILDQAGELLLTIFSSLAQEESRSISENVKLGIRSAYKRGQYRIHFSQYIGYDKLENGTLQINDDAWIIRYLYHLFYEGNSFQSIADILNEEGIIRPNGNGKWLRGNVKAIFFNEVYCGDVRLQKTYVKNYLDHKAVKNEGALPQYYIFDDHKPLIPRELFYYTQYQYKKHMSTRGNSSNRPLYPSGITSMKIYCEKCNCLFGLRTGHSNDKYRFEFFRCNNFYNECGCDSTTIKKKVLEKLFVDVLDELNGESYKEVFQVILKALNPHKITVKIQKKAEKIAELRHTIEVTPSEATAFIESTQHKLEKRESEYFRLEKEKEHCEALYKTILDIYNKDSFHRSFDASTYSVLLEQVTVNKNLLTFVFRNGNKISRSYYHQPSTPVNKELVKRLKETALLKAPKPNKPKPDRRCLNCGQLFQGNKNQSFCNSECYNEFVSKVTGGKL